MSKIPHIPIAIVLLWLVGTGAGFVVLSEYQNAKGAMGATPQNWPSQARVSLDPKRDTLVMFVHPHCPCSAASVEELNRLLSRHSQGINAQILFFRPKGFPAGWTQSTLWRAAVAIPGVRVQEDLDGAQARLFGAETSGYVLLYDSQGKLRFKGGITGSRGHAGDNAGEDAIVSLLDGQEPDICQTPVYGCSLLDKCQSSSSLIPN